MMKFLCYTAIILFSAFMFFSCSNNSCPENCIRITGFVKDSSTGGGAANLPYEVYWVKKRSISKLDLIDTGSTDAKGRIDKSFPIDRDRWKTQQIFVRVLPNTQYRQIDGTFITSAIEEDVPSAEVNFTVFQTTELTIILQPIVPGFQPQKFLLTYEYDGKDYKAYSDSGGVKKMEHKVRTAAGVVTRVSALTPNAAGILKRNMDSITCLPGKPNTITIRF